MKGEQSGVKSSPENTVKEMRQQIDPTGRKLFQPFEFMTSSQMRSLFSRMSVLHKGGTLKPPSPSMELVDDINEVLDYITEKNLKITLKVTDLHFYTSLEDEGGLIASCESSKSSDMF
ncbi:hypothetical protein AVEN_38493-1 [Araneus ventricosus]|uniref:Uncharacterized protein n=1 Tax=Araneus ventricosus TaxID=182803 RepID=A0A4Y2JD61_ARAVE|nr:hypothetical protein AVEN_38493-1 [Araneus ventricosus]